MSPNETVGLLDEESVVEYLVERAVVDDPRAFVEALPGGVSNVVLAVADGGRQLAANQLIASEEYSLALEVAMIERWCKEFPIVSIEDVLEDDDWAGWAEASRSLLPGRQLIGNDLFATELGRLERGIAAGIANAALVKPNQAGTMARAERVVRRAKEAGYATVVSARSGDAEDSWLADAANALRGLEAMSGSGR